MLNPIFLKKVQGQKHPRRWDIAEGKIPGVKMLFNANTNGYKRPIVSLFIIKQDTIGYHYKVWDEIIYPSLNVIGTTVEVLEWISNFILHITGYIITYPCWDKSWIM